MHRFVPRDSVQHRYSLHGFELSISLQVPGLTTRTDEFLDEFATSPITTGKPAGASLHGIIRPFDQQDVLRHVSPTARRITPEDDLMELFAEGDRAWRIDERWGICEMNVLKGQWRSWVLPCSLADETEIVEQAILWPLAQVLAPRGLCLIPAASVARDGQGVLILSKYSIASELDALARAGYGIVGQSWTALREEKGRIVMLRIPGASNRADFSHPLTRSSAFRGVVRQRAECDSILIVAAGRRSVASVQPIDGAIALAELRRAWPMPDLHSHRRPSKILSGLAHQSSLFDVQLARNATDILPLIESVRAPARPKVAVSLHLRQAKARLVA